MRRAKFFGTLMVCILAIEAGLISTAWAKKPSWVGIETEYGYAELADGNYMIQSDGEDQYADKSKGGEDVVEIKINSKTRDLAKSNTVIGPDETQPSPPGRRVHFRFNISDPSIVRDIPGADLAAYQLLCESQVEGGHLPDGSVHFQVVSGWVDWGDDPGHGSGEARFMVEGITQEDVYACDPDAPRYWPSENGHIIYCLDSGGIDVSGSEPAWKLGLSGGQVKLSVWKYKNKKRGPIRVEEVLVIYKENLPFFELTASLNSLDTGPLAPRKHKTTSTLWGEMKAR